MSSFFFDRRRSEHFAELLEDPDRLHRHRRLSRTQAEMDWGVRALSRMRRFPQATVAPQDFRDGLRGMLMAAANRENENLVTASLTPTRVAPAGRSEARTRTSRRTSAAETTVRLGALADRTQPVGRRHRGRRSQTRLRSQGPGTGRTRAAVLIGVTAGALALSGVSAASTDSLPGDPLYQVKRSSERAQLALAASDQTRGQLYLEFAHSRVLEARQITGGLVADVLADMDGETVAGVKLLTTAALARHDAAILNAITTFVDDQRVRLANLRRTLKASAVDRLNTSTALLDSIEERNRALAYALVKGCPIGIYDSLGPKPTIC